MRIYRCFILIEDYNPQWVAAKPIIDVDIVVRTHEDVEKTIGRLGNLGYIHKGQRGIRGRELMP
jgi:GrpB-like predicted nucleotidyltransferase (UPF0157 family)